METELFDYDLPQELIAQVPISPRDASRMMIVSRSNGEISHAMTRDLASFIKPNEVVLLNESRVIPARVRLRKIGSGGAVELLFLKPLANGEWRALARPSSRLREGAALAHENDPANPAVFLEQRLENGGWRVRAAGRGGIEGIISRYGMMPLPPYIDRKKRRDMDEVDHERYQTVYARVDGSVAAPTAGLHITEDVLDRVRAIPAGISRCVLHVGLGTFKPVTADRIEEHKMEPEAYEVGEEACSALMSAMADGRRILAVGTTSVRVLETAGKEIGAGRKSVSGETSLFITPGYSFRTVGALLTNFHMPRSTLLMLVSAFAGLELTRKAYETAASRGYRFLSYGDAMLVI